MRGVTWSSYNIGCVFRTLKSRFLYVNQPALINKNPAPARPKAGFKRLKGIILKINQFIVFLFLRFSVFRFPNLLPGYIFPAANHSFEN